MTIDSLTQARELFDAGLRHQHAGEYQRAEALYRQALVLAPGRASVMSNLAAVLLQVRGYKEAQILCETLLAGDPANATAWLNLGNCRLALGAPEIAVDCYDKALELNPGYFEALNSRAKALLDLRRPAEALRSSEQALAAQPNQHDALNNHGGAMLDLGRYEDAVASYDRAIALHPDFASAHYNRGNALGYLRRYEEALASYGRASAAQPDFVDAHWNEALCRLLTGDFARGWQKYEWRWKNEQGRQTKRRFPVAAWNGERLDGTLLVWGEQGLGEQILHAAMLPQAAALVKKLVVEVHPKLVALFARSFAGMEVTAPGSPERAGVDAHVPICSLGGYFRQQWEDFPRDSKYLVPDQQRVTELRTRLAGNERYIVGLSWFSTTKRVGENKSVRLEELAPLLKSPEIRFVDLQYGNTRAEREHVDRLLGVHVHHIDDVDNENDLDALAALVSACDAVVSISNTTAHLAGALGKPVYLVLPYALPSHWHWHIGHDRSPWYRTVRMFRQPAVGDWHGAIADAAHELIADLASGPAAREQGDSSD